MGPGGTMKTNIYIIFILILAFSIVSSPLNAGEKAGKNIETEILLNQRIPLKDGISLSANVYKPLDIKEPLPAIFTFTPYISDEGQKWGPYMVKHGYVYVHADVRGRGNSEGEFYPIENDGADGAQVVEWIAKQPWCSGQVAMRGGSYRGGVQWQIMKHFPKALKTTIPTASVCVGIDVPILKNIFYSYTARWLAFTSFKTPNGYLFGDSSYWNEKYYKMYSQHIPFEKLAEITGSNTKLFKRWISHPTVDDFWKNIGLASNHYAKLDIPILTITGYFDGDQPGAMNYFHKHMKHGTEKAKKNHYLLIGPWDHAGTRNPRKEMGGLTFPNNSIIDMKTLHVQWFDWVLKGKEKPKFLKKRITYYVMEENKWKYADTLDELANDKLIWHLSSQNGKANDIFHSGTLTQTPPAKKQKPDTFYYDPLELMTKKEYIAMRNVQDFLLYQGGINDGKNTRVIYHSPPLKQDVITAGYIELKLYLSLNVPDTDLEMTVYEIKPNGKSITLASNMLRARYRNSLTKQELVKPNKIELYHFKKPFFTARKLTKGSRIRLIIKSPNTPDIQKNYNSGTTVSKETAKHANKATIKIYHNKKYKSVLIFPVKR